MYEKVTFSKNHNKKLFNDCFTAIDLAVKEFYKGQKVEILLKNRRFGLAEVLEVRKFDIEQLPTISTFLDSGMERTDFIKMVQRKYLKSNISIIDYKMQIVLFKYYDRERISKPWLLRFNHGS